MNNNSDNIYQKDRNIATHRAPELKYMFDLVVLDAETGAEVGDKVVSYAACADAPANPSEIRLVDIAAACAVIAVARSFELLSDTDTV